jgi:LysM repeat protein
MWEEAAVGTVLALYDRGIDYSGFRPSPVGDPARHGARFVLRYSAGVGNGRQKTLWKRCGKTELRDIVAAGLDFIANSEWYESRATEGAAAGADDGAADLAFWRARGLAKGASIYVSWDEGQPDTRKHTKLAAYLNAYDKALGGYYHVDLYAGDVAIAAMRTKGLIRYGWRAMADSWSDNGSYYRPSNWKAVARTVATVSQAHIWQNGNRWYDGRADENVILRLPVGSHLEALGGGGSEAQIAAVSAAAQTGSAPAGSAAMEEYEVRRGDTFSGIAAAYGVTLDGLKQLNPRAGHPPGNFDIIWPGDTLRVSGSPVRPKGKAVHIVRPGDTLSAIAAGWGITLAALKAANPNAGHPPGNFDVIRPGDRILHP